MLLFIRMMYAINDINDPIISDIITLVLIKVLSSKGSIIFF